MKNVTKMTNSKMMVRVECAPISWPADPAFTTLPASRGAGPPGRTKSVIFLTTTSPGPGSSGGVGEKGREKKRRKEEERGERRRRRQKTAGRPVSRARTGREAQRSRSHTGTLVDWGARRRYSRRSWPSWVWSSVGSANHTRIATLASATEGGSGTLVPRTDRTRRTHTPQEASVLW